MKRENYLTPEFYENQSLTLDVFNELMHLSNQNADNIYVHTMFPNGKFCSLVFYDNECVREILSTVIKDIDAYIGSFPDKFSGEDGKVIDLSMLYKIHGQSFSSAFTIVWIKELGEFAHHEEVFAECY